MKSTATVTGLYSSSKRKLEESKEDKATKKARLIKMKELATKYIKEKTVLKKDDYYYYNIFLTNTSHSILGLTCSP